MRSARVSIALLSLRNDIHAIAVKAELARFSRTVCAIVEADHLFNAGSLNWWSPDHSRVSGCLPTSDEAYVDVKSIDAIWVRRFGPQKGEGLPTDRVSRDLINRESEAALLGLLATDFSGVLINHPIATGLAENKMVQLRAARAAGFSIPRTLVSQDPQAIREFGRRLPNGVIVKPLTCSSIKPLYTLRLTKEMLSDDGSLRACPAIYQEFVLGRRHLRVHCFGKSAYAVLIVSKDLDWRRNLDVPFSPTTLSISTQRRLQKVMQILGLKMGVFDFKLDKNGTPVWLEVNPQGQFLFAEGLSGLPLARPFAEFLHSQAIEAAERRRRGKTGEDRIRGAKFGQPFSRALA